MRVENKFDTGHVMFEMTMAILVGTKNRQSDIGVQTSGEKYRLETSVYGVITLRVVCKVLQMERNPWGSA